MSPGPVIATFVVVNGTRRVRRSRDDRVIAGVAGGIGAHLGVDPVLIRISFVALALAGVGIVIYLVAWLLIPELPRGEDPPDPVEGNEAMGTRILIGTALVLVGILLLIDVYVPIRKLVWPLAVIVAGVAVITYGVRK